MSVILAPNRPCQTSSEVRNHAVNFEPILDSGELLTGTPTIEEVTTMDLTIDNVAVSTAALTIEGASVAIGQAVQYNITGGSGANSPYTIKITATTDSTPAQTLIRTVEFVVLADP